MKNIENKIANSVLPELINSLYKEGVLNDFDLTNKESLFSKIKLYLEKTEIEFEIIVDHRETILKIAEQEFKNGNSQLSVTLFATYIEIIKSVNIVGKCTWLLKILGLPQFRNEYLKTITKISEERNAYIHYKWKPEPDEEVRNLSKQETEKQEKYLEIKKLLKYLSNYETRHEFGGRKKKIINSTKK